MIRYEPLDLLHTSFPRCRRQANPADTSRVMPVMGKTNINMASL
jgi:hypothetical protein